MKRNSKQRPTNDAKAKREMYSGNIQLKFENVEDYTQVNRFCEVMTILTNMKVSGYNWSENKGLSITIFLKDSLPLEEILKRLPMIESINKKKKDIILTFNHYSPETVFPVLKNSQEGILFT